MAAANNHQDREYFTPTEVPGQLSHGARSCVPACCAFLGLSVPTNPKGEAHPAPAWNEILQRISPEGSVIRSFNALCDIEEHLDNLFVAAMNMGGAAGAGHSAVLYRGEQQMGSTKCHLYNPGPGNWNSAPLIDVSRKRDTARWNYICAAFVPGTNIQTNDTEIVDISDDESRAQPLLHIAQSGSGAAASSSSSTSTRASSPSPSKNGSVQRANSRRVPSMARGGGNAVASDNGFDGTSPPRRTPSRATKRSNSMPSRFYKENLQALAARPDYSRVTQYTYSDKLPKECTKEVLGQHVAKYLHDGGLGWVIWFHHDSSRFVIAQKAAFSGYDIEAAEEGKGRFIGYAALAEWAFKEGIYEKSLKNRDGEAFLDEVGIEDDPYILFNSTNASSVRKRTRKMRSADNGSKKKRNKHDDVALREQLVAEFEEEEERIANETQAAKPAAKKAKDPSDDDEMSGKSYEEESSFGGGDYNNYGDDDDNDDDEEWKDDETKEQPEAYSTDEEQDEQQGSMPKPKQVSNETAQQESSQANDGDVSDLLDDDVSGTAQLNESHLEERGGGGGGGGGEVEAARNQDILNEMEELKAELKVKSQAEAKLKAELKAKSDEVGALQAENNHLRNEINVIKAEVNNASRTQAEDMGSDQDELDRLRHDNETKNRENNRLRRELEFVESANSKIADLLRTFRALGNDDE